VLQINPDQTVALNNLAGALMLRRQYAEAEQLLLHAAQVEVGVVFYRQAIMAQLLQGKRAEAVATMDRMAKAVGETPFLPVTRGEFAAALQSYDSAQAWFRIVQARPELSLRAFALNGLGAIDMLRGKLANAERWYRELMAVNEKRGQPGSYLGTVALAGDLDVIYRQHQAAAIKTVEAALLRYPLAKMPALDRPYSELALFYAMAGQPARAKQLLAEYDASVPEPIRRTNPWRHYAAGQTALADGRAPDAITEFRAWCDELACADYSIFELGLAYDAAKQPDSALAVYQRAVTVPKHLYSVYSDAFDLARNYKRLGELYEERGNRDRAAEYYGKLIDLWKEADPELQPQVREVKERLARLAGEKK
jgi:tetratricopeptide (TPR) repeat protein